jgi:hypothetical protein
MPKFRGINYQRNGNKNQSSNQANFPKVSQNPPKSNEYASSDLNIDLGGRLSNAKMLVPMSELMKIPY